MASIDWAIDKLRSLGPDLVKEVVDDIAKDALALIGEEFSAGQDPYGVAWEKPTTRDNPPLEESLSLEGSFRSDVSGTGVTISNDKWYASIHQYGGKGGGRRAKGAAKTPRRPRRSQKGSKGFPRRQMLPEGKLGPTWEARFRATIEAKWQSHWK